MPSEVFKTSFGKIPKTYHSETSQKPYFGGDFTNEVNFFNSQSKFFIRYQILLRGHLPNKFLISAQSEHFCFSGNDSLIYDLT